MKLRCTILLALTALACGGNGSGADAADVVDVDAAPDLPDILPDEPSDELSDDASAEAEADAPPIDPCTTLGLTKRPWDDSGSGSALFAVAEDLTLETWDGSWNFAESWSGCDVHLFIQDEPAQEADWPIGIWERDVGTLFRRLPRNTQLFFVSTSGAVVTRNDRLVALQTLIQSALATLSAEDQAWWAARIRYLPRRHLDQPGWLGTLMGRPGWGVAIDRFQRIRYIGSYADYDRYDAGRGWFAPNLAMVANEVVYYNYEAEREERLAAEDATVVPIYQNVEFAGSTFQNATIALPAPAEMAGYDTLELDLTMGCVGDGEYGDCPAWDGVFFLELCDEGETSCDRDTGTEMGRWITTYHRIGRYVHDVSPLLPLLAGGGTRSFSSIVHDRYAITLSLRFSNQGKAVRPVETHSLFRANGGGNFSATYNDLFPDVTVAVPATAARVEIVAAITGHGMAMPGNCAEFCEVENTFAANGTSNVISFPIAGADDGCMQQVASGTVPNQYGTWWYGRNGWCPGRQVDLVAVDVTEQVTLGADNVFGYGATFSGGPYTGSGAGIELKSWLVVYE